MKPVTQAEQKIAALVDARPVGGLDVSSIVDIAESVGFHMTDEEEHFLVRYLLFRLDNRRKVEHRREPRFPLSGKFRILWEDSEGQDRISRAELVNVSVRGVKLLVDAQIPTRTYVMVNERKLGIMGRGSVRYCRAEKGKFAIGIEFSGGTGWKP